MMAKPLVLVVDDEPGFLRLVDLVLSNEGFNVIEAETGAEALSLTERRRPDIILLDIWMPDMTGLEVMRRLRERMNTPVILLTGQDQDEQKVLGLESGADDYMVKPFNPRELGARVRAVLRRAHSAAGENNKVCIGDLEIDLDARLVKKGGELVFLTRTEWRLLQQLALNVGRVMLQKELLTRVWGPEYRDDIQYLRVWISRLRAKLENVATEPKIIATFPGIGYMLTPSTMAGAEVGEPADFSLADKEAAARSPVAPGV